MEADFAFGNYSTFAVILMIVIGWRAIGKAFYEISLLCWMSNGERYRDTKPPNRLYNFICATKYLDQVTVDEVFNLAYPHVTSKIGDREATLKAFHSTMLSYSNIVLCRDKIDGSLRGMTLVGFIRAEKYTLIRLGLSFFKNHYRGGPNMYLAISCYVIRELTLHPFTPLYIVGKAFGYRSYLVGLKFTECYPRYDRETPEHFKTVLREFAHSVMIEGDSYNEETNVLKQERTHLTENLLAVSEQDLQNPHIKFFVERNPGHLKGHCLVLGWKMSWLELLRAVYGALKPKTIKGDQYDSPQHETVLSNKKWKPELLSRIGFQDESANAYAQKVHKLHLAGEKVLSARHNFAFQLLTKDVPEFNF